MPWQEGHQGVLGAAGGVWWRGAKGAGPAAPPYTTHMLIGLGPPRSAHPNRPLIHLEGAILNYDARPPWLGGQGRAKNMITSGRKSDCGLADTGSVPAYTGSVPPYMCRPQVGRRQKVPPTHVGLIRLDRNGRAPTSGQRSYVFTGHQGPLPTGRVGRGVGRGVHLGRRGD